MDYPFLSEFWMFIANIYSTFNEFIFFSEYSVLLTKIKANNTLLEPALNYIMLRNFGTVLPIFTKIA